MNSKRAYFIMCGLAVLFLLAIVGGAYEINGILGQKSQKLVAAKAKLTSLQQEQIELKQAKKDVATYSDLYKISRAIVPQNKDQAETVRQIIKLASDNGVTIQSITFPNSTLGGGAAGATGASSATTSAGAASSVASGANASLSQLKKVPNIPGVYVLELAVSSSNQSGKGASYRQLISFLSALEQNRLTALVSTIAITPAKSSTATSSTSLPTSFAFQLTLDIYIKP